MRDGLPVVWLLVERLENKCISGEKKVIGSGFPVLSSVRISTFLLLRVPPQPELDCPRAWPCGLFSILFNLICNTCPWHPSWLSWFKELIVCHKNSVFTSLHRSDWYIYLYSVSTFRDSKALVAVKIGWPTSLKSCTNLLAVQLVGCAVPLSTIWATVPFLFQNLDTESPVSW